jgi:ABC-type branched-subunit amino acid transport system substrate-binding protein
LPVGTALLLCLALLAGCGARLSKQQVAEASAPAAAAAAGATGAPQASDEPTSVPAAGAGSPTTLAQASAPSPATGGAAAPTTTVAKAAGASTASTPTTAAGGNGGATDVGVTANSITVANVSTITGPVPGLFAGAVNGTQAFFAYQNSQGGVFGRQLKLQVIDDRFDCGTNRSATEQALGSVFAFVGSFSLFDGCGAAVLAAKPEIPDVHPALAAEAQKEPNNYSATPVKPGLSMGVVNYIKSHFPNSIGAVGSLVGDVQSAKDAWAGAKKVMQANGISFTYERLYAPTETDFTADIVQMRSKGVKLVIEISADAKSVARIQTAAQQQNWKPDAWFNGASTYDSNYLPLAGSASEGTYVYLGSAMYMGEDSGMIPEVALFQTWLKKTHPGAPVDVFAADSWASARLFVQALQAAGPKATRASLTAALQNVHSFASNGFLAEADPAGKGPASCFIIIRVQGGKFTRVEPASGFKCDGPFVVAG